MSDRAFRGELRLQLMKQNPTPFDPDSVNLEAVDTRLSRILSSTAVLSATAGICMTLWSAYNMYLILSCGEVSEAFKTLFQGNIEIRRTMTHDLVIFVDRTKIITFAQVALWVLAAYGSMILCSDSIKIIRTLKKFKGKLVFDQIVVVLMITTGVALAIYFYHNLGDYYYYPMILKSNIISVTGSFYDNLHGTSEPDMSVITIMGVTLLTLMIFVKISERIFSFSNKLATAFEYMIALGGLCVLGFILNSLKSTASNFRFTFDMPFALLPFLILLCFLFFILVAFHGTMSCAVGITLKETPLLLLISNNLKRWFKEYFWL